MLHKDSQAMKIEPVDISSDLDVAHVAGDIQEKHRGDGEASQGASSATSVSVGSHQLGHLGRFSVLVLPPRVSQRCQFSQFGTGAAGLGKSSACQETMAVRCILWSEIVGCTFIVCVFGI